jgi:hypothetical protein
MKAASICLPDTVVGSPFFTGTTPPHHVFGHWRIISQALCGIWGPVSMPWV